MSIASNIWPVWKYKADNVNNGGGDVQDVRFRVRACGSEADALNATAGTVIYEGIASAAPNSNECLVSINDIVADYLSVARLCGWFALDVYDTGTNAFGYWAHYYFVMDYSYDYDFNAAAMPLAHPVMGIAAPNQWVVATFIDADGEGGVTWEITDADGATYTGTIPLAPCEDFNTAFNNDFADGGSAAEVGYAALDLAHYPDAVSVKFSLSPFAPVIYRVRQDTCKRYALYYRNAYGGYDSLLLDDAVREENYTRATIGRWADNAIRGQREIHDYRNGIEEAWTLRVAALTDTQAERMPQVLGSTDAYLCDLMTRTLTPLVIADTQCIVKTYRNQGGKRIEYTINARTAQKRERR